MNGTVLALGLGLAACSPDACSRSSGVLRDGGAMPLEIHDDLATVPAGWFSAGCFRVLARAGLPGRDPNDLGEEQTRAWHCVLDDPPRRLWLSSFAIDRFAVTYFEYAECLRAGRCKLPQHEWYGQLDNGENYHAPYQLADVPFAAAEAFCDWRGKRLPTAAEWQKAARGTDDRIFPWGDSPEGKCTWVAHGYDTHQPQLNSVPNCVMDVERSGRGHPDEQSPYGVQDLRLIAGQWVQGVSHIWDPWEVDSPRHVEGQKAPPTVPPGFRFSLEAHPGFAVLVLDWSSIWVKRRDPSVIDPKDHGDAPASPSSRHQTRGAHGWITGTSTMDGPEEHATFRCVRSIPGPPPPAVTAPPANELAPPFREPGFNPPGTPASDQNGPSR